MNLARQALQLFEQALDQPPERLSTFLDAACAGDNQLREEVESLLATVDCSDAFLLTSRIQNDSTDSLASPSRLQTERDARLSPDQKLVDRYKIIRPLGSGGMGQVYEANDERLERDVAVKVLHLAIDANDEMMDRFEREIKSIASLSHPNIVALHDISDHGDIKFAVMELARGKTLRTLVRDPIPWQRSVAISSGIASGLYAAHAQNIMHRDIKPENVIVTDDDGQAKILDFGLARRVSIQADQQLTVGEVALGTIPYMSPEQVEGKELTCATDIFSFGSVLYEMLTGTHPFRASTAFQTMNRVTQANPTRIASITDNVPNDLIGLVSSMLSVQPERRPKASEIVNRLEALQSLTGTETKVASSVPTNLPGRPLHLTGREQQIDDIRSKLNANPIVTVLGPGGVGKTSIAVSVAQGAIENFPGGVWLCELAPMRSDDDVVDCIAGVLDGSAGSTSGLDEVVKRLQGQPTLLILDNCEHVIEGAADAAEALSRHVPNLTVFATSRESLGLSGETVCRLDGLAFDGPDSDAAKFFIERASSIGDFQDDAASRLEVEKVVTRLEGLPLAIELAAPRLGVMSLQELLAALDDQITTLRSSRRAKNRQGTIDQAIAWSFDLLEPEQQAMMLNLSVFVASFTADAALAVHGSTASAKIILQRLVEQSVVVRQERKGLSRYRLLEPIRQFCQARIDEVSQEAAISRHAHFYAQRAIELAQGIHGVDERNAAAALNAEWADLRESVAWGRQQRIAEIAVDPIIALARTIMFHLRTEGYQWLIETEKVLGDEVANRGDVNWVLANGYWVMGNPERAEEYLTRAESIAVTPQTMWAKYFLRFSQKRFEESADAAEQAETMAIAAGDETEIRWWSNAFRICPLTLADPNDPRIETKLASSIEFIEKLNWPTGHAFLAMARGTVAITRGKTEDAMRFRDQAIELAASCGNRWIDLIVRLVVGSDATMTPEEKLTSAITNLRSLIDLGEEAHYPIAIRTIVMAIAESGKLELAAKCSGVVDSLKGVGDGNEFSPEYVDIMNSVAESLGETRFESLQKDGATITVEQIADLADKLV